MDEETHRTIDKALKKWGNSSWVDDHYREEVLNDISSALDKEGFIIGVSRRDAAPLHQERRVREFYYFFLADEWKSTFTRKELGKLLEDFHKETPPDFHKMLNRLADYECYGDFLDENSFRESSPKSVNALLDEIVEFIKENTKQ